MRVWLLGDSGYPQRPWLMTPIIYDAVEGSPEAKYNSVHGKTRVRVENTFVRLKNRWRCLCKDRTLHYAPEKCAKISCSVLHNLAINFNMPDPEPDTILNDQLIFSRHEFQENYVGDDLVRGRVFRTMLVERINRLHTKHYHSFLIYLIPFTVLPSKIDPWLKETFYINTVLVRITFMSSIYIIAIIRLLNLFSGNKTNIV